MMKLARLNSIAARITIIAAIVLGIVMEIALAVAISYVRAGNERAHFVLSRNNVGVINPRRNALIVSGRIVTIARALASAPEVERPRIIADLVDPAMQIALR